MPDSVRFMTCDDGAIACRLSDIAEALTGFNVDGFLSTLLATLVGAFVAAGTSMWVAGRERPVPMWRVTTELPHNSLSTQDGKTQIPVTLTNIGDGPGYNVRLSVAGVMSYPPQTVAKVDPGEHGKTSISVPLKGQLRMNIETGMYADERQLNWPGRATLTVEWQQPPRRHRVRKSTFAIPNPQPSDHESRAV